jgi:hypothetical protein
MVELDGDFEVRKPNAQPFGMGHELDHRRAPVIGLAHATSEHGPKLPSERTRKFDQGSPTFHFGVVGDWDRHGSARPCSGRPVGAALPAARP